MDNYVVEETVTKDDEIISDITYEYDEKGNLEIETEIEAEQQENLTHSNIQSHGQDVLLKRKRKNLIGKKGDNIMINYKPISFYTNKNDTSVFDVGLVLYRDNEGVVILSVLKDGSYDNTQYIKNDCIYLCEYDDFYCNEMSKKIDMHILEKHVVDFKTGVDSKNQVIEFCMNENLVVSIELIVSGNVDVYGIIEKINNDFITVKKFDDADNEDGKAVVRIENITRISFKK